jgi:hypothetical protein
LEIDYAQTVNADLFLFAAEILKNNRSAIFGSASAVKTGSIVCNRGRHNDVYSVGQLAISYLDFIGIDNPVSGTDTVVDEYDVIVCIKQHRNK